MKLYFIILKALACVWVMSVVTVFSLSSVGKNEMVLVIFIVSITMIFMLVLYYFLKKCGIWFPSSPLTLILDRPHEIVAQRQDGKDNYATFKPLVAFDENHEKVRHRLRFINLGIMTTPSKYVIPTLKGNAFTFQVFPEEKVTYVDPKGRFKRF